MAPLAAKDWNSVVQLDIAYQFTCRAVPVLAAGGGAGLALEAVYPFEARY
jgi:hypothetical protein